MIDTSDLKLRNPNGFNGVHEYTSRDGTTKYKYYTNKDRSVWINTTFSDGLVGVYLRGRNGWNYYDTDEYQKILALLETI